MKYKNICKTLSLDIDDKFVVHATSMLNGRHST